MVKLYVHLLQGLEHKEGQEQWRRKSTALHNALHEKLLSARDCPVCVGCRLRQDTRWQSADWNFKAVILLFDFTANTIREHGTGWQAWRPTRVDSGANSLPAKLHMEDIPRDRVQELPGGVFKWGRYQTNREQRA